MGRYETEGTNCVKEQRKKVDEKVASPFLKKINNASDSFKKRNNLEIWPMLKKNQAKNQVEI